MNVPFVLSAEAVFNAQAVARGVEAADSSLLLSWAVDVFELAVGSGEPPESLHEYGNILKRMTLGLVHRGRVHEEVRAQLAQEVERFGEVGRWADMVRRGAVRGDTWLLGRMTPFHSAADVFERAEELLAQSESKTETTWRLLDFGKREDLAWLQRYLASPETFPRSVNVDKGVQALRAIGCDRYPFNPDGEPYTLGKWGELSEIVDFAGRSFRELEPLFYLYLSGEVTGETVAALGRIPEGAELAKAARRGGYAFDTALQYCLLCDDPLSGSKVMELAMAKWKTDSLAGKRMRNLSAVDRLALYAVWRELSDVREARDPVSI